MDLYLIRHGESTFNAADRSQGHLNSRLTGRGREQARAVGRHLADHRFGAIYTSIMDRSLETARIIAQHHDTDVRGRKGLRGIDLGLDAGRTEEEISAAVQEAEQDGRYWTPRGGEDPETFHERITRVIDRIVRRHDDDLCIVGHAGIIRTYIVRYRDEDVYSAYEIPQDNCAINIINVEAQDLYCVNDTEHLR
jgi:broad specificity phosphatase PhoE